MTTEPSRAYWSERSGRRPAARKLTATQVRTLFASYVAELESRGSLQESFGYDCVDAGFVAGSLGPAIDERMLLILGHEGIWPISVESALDWSEDEFFDIVEFLYDHVSSGDKRFGQHHTFAGCGWHFDRFDRGSARAEYRGRINELLGRLETGYELSEPGEILRSTPDGLAPLLDAELPGLTSDDSDHVAAAIHKFRSRSSTPTQRRDAVRDLADVLESIRADVKAHLFSEDERAIFEIANKFWIRHNKPGERRKYDHEAWWSWLFYLYLDSIALVTRLRQRDSSNQ